MSYRESRRVQLSRPVRDTGLQKGHIFKLLRRKNLQTCMQPECEDLDWFKSKMIRIWASVTCRMVAVVFEKKGFWGWERGLKVVLALLS